MHKLIVSILKKNDVGLYRTRSLQSHYDGGGGGGGGGGGCNPLGLFKWPYSGKMQVIFGQKISAPPPPNKVGPVRLRGLMVLIRMVSITYCYISLG